MTVAERLLDLTVEYVAAKEVRSYGFAGDSPAGREPSTIVADYEAALREMLAPASL